MGTIEAESLKATPMCPASAKDAVSLLQVAMKCADLGHLALDWNLHVAWVQRLESEFFAQGDQEKALGLPVSFLMDREKPGVSCPCSPISPAYVASYHSKL